MLFKKKDCNTIWYNENLGIPPIAGYAERNHYIVPSNAFTRSVSIIRHFVQGEIFKWILDKKYNALYDSSCAGLLKHCAKYVFEHPTRPRTYIGVYAPLDTITKRCETRGENQGRIVPRGILLQNYADLYGNDDKLKAYNELKSKCRKYLKPGDEIYMFDNSTKLKLIDKHKE